MNMNSRIYILAIALMTGVGAMAQNTKQNSNAEKIEKYTVQTNRDGAMREVDVISESGKAYQTGDRTVITRYQDGTLYIQ